MTMEDHDPRRRSIRVQGYDYAGVGGYFVTVVAFQRKCIFGEIVKGEMRLNAIGKIVEECWDEIPLHFPNAEIDAFVIMPNHIHGIIMLFDDRGTIYRAPTRSFEEFGKPTVGSLPTIMRTFKAAVTRNARRELNGTHIWQRNYFEHIIRDQTDYQRIAGYIAVNPMKWDTDEENPRQTSISV
jgi:putative transposase